MSDLNEMTRDELKEQANILGVTYANNITTEKLISLINIALGNSDEMEGAEPAPSTKKPQYKGMIHKDGKDKQPVPIGVNGRVIRIKRGEVVTIDEPFFHALENAIKRVWDPDLKEMIEIPAYGHSFQKI